MPLPHAHLIANWWANEVKKNSALKTSPAPEQVEAFRSELFAAIEKLAFPFELDTDQVGMSEVLRQVVERTELSKKHLPTCAMYVEKNQIRASKGSARRSIDLLKVCLDDEGQVISYWSAAEEEEQKQRRFEDRIAELVASPDGLWLLEKGLLYLDAGQHFKEGSLRTSVVFDDDPTLLAIVTEKEERNAPVIFEKVVVTSEVEGVRAWAALPQASSTALKTYLLSQGWVLAEVTAHHAKQVLWVPPRQAARSRMGRYAKTLEPDWWKRPTDKGGTPA